MVLPEINKRLDKQNYRRSHVMFHINLGCQDHNPSCGDWAAIGECDMNKAWMKKHCCKSCYGKISILNDEHLIG